MAFFGLLSSQTAGRFGKIIKVAVLGYLYSFAGNQLVRGEVIVKQPVQNVVLPDGGVLDFNFSASDVFQTDGTLSVTAAVPDGSSLPSWLSLEILPELKHHQKGFSGSLGRLFFPSQHPATALMTVKHDVEMYEVGSGNFTFRDSVYLGPGAVGSRNAIIGLGELSGGEVVAASNIGKMHVLRLTSDSVQSVSEVDTANSFRSLVVSGQTIFASDITRLKSFDASNPLNITESGRGENTGGNTSNRLRVHNDLLLEAGANGGVFLYDVSDPRNLTQLDRVFLNPPLRPADDVTFLDDGRFAVVIFKDLIHVYDLQNRDLQTLVSSVESNQLLSDKAVGIVAARTGRIALITGQFGIHAVRLQEDGQLQLLTPSYNFATHLDEVVLRGNDVFAINGVEGLFKFSFLKHRLAGTPPNDFSQLTIELTGNDGNGNTAKTSFVVRFASSPITMTAATPSSSTRSISAGAPTSGSSVPSDDDTTTEKVKEPSDRTDDLMMDMSNESMLMILAIVGSAVGLLATLGLAACVFMYLRSKRGGENAQDKRASVVQVECAQSADVSHRQSLNQYSLMPGDPKTADGYDVVPNGGAVGQYGVAPPLRDDANGSGPTAGAFGLYGDAPKLDDQRDSQYDAPSSALR